MYVNMVFYLGSVYCKEFLG